MIIKFTKDEIKERDSIEDSYDKLIKELEYKLETLRDDPEPDEKKLAALDKARQKIKPPKKGRNAENEHEYFSSPEYQAYLKKISENEEAYFSIIKEWEDAGTDEWKAARAELDRLEAERDNARRDFYKRCEDRHFKALGGDLQRIYKDATQQVVQFIETQYNYYERKLESDEYTGFSAIDVNKQVDGSFLLDKEETRRLIIRSLKRHFDALEADSKLVASLKEYIEQVLSRSAYVSTEGIKGALIEKKAKPQKESDDILVTRPDKYVTTQDRVSKKAFENKLMNLQPDEALWSVKLDSAGKVRVRVAIDYNELLKTGEITKIPSLNARDYNVHDAIITLLCAGNRVMTYDMIYRAMTGITDTKHALPDEARAIIDESLSKFKGRFILEYSRKDKEGNEIVDDYNEPLVDFAQKRRKINGKIVDGAIELTGKDPPLLRWARSNGNEIDTRDISLLNVPRLNNGDESLTIKMCLYRRIITMRNAFERIKKSRSELALNERSIRFDYIYEALGLETDKLSRDKKHDIKAKIDKILSYWKDKGFISDYEYRKDKSANNAISSLVVSFMQAERR